MHGLLFTENKHQHDDDDSGMGPSTFTDTKSTNFSEVYCCIDAGNTGSVVRSYTYIPLYYIGSSGRRDKGIGL